MRILITGGAGFIGSHMTERFLRDGHSVSILDDLSTGSMNNLAGVTGNPALNCVVGSICDKALVDRMVGENDIVVHLAAAVGVQTILNKPANSLLTNVGGTETVLEAAAHKNRLVVIASSSEVYGKSTQMPYREDADVVMGATATIRWSYAYAKAVDECLALAYAHEGRAKPIVVRFFNTTGPRQTGEYGMVLPKFVDAALQNRPIQVYGDGTQRRSFGHVKDAVEAVARLVQTPAAVGQVFNIGNDEEVSIMALAERVRAATGSTSPIEVVPYDKAYAKGFEDMQRRVPSLSKLEAMIGFRPRTPLDAIISDIIAEKRAGQ